MGASAVVLELRPPRLAVALFGASLVAVAVAVVAFALTSSGPPLHIAAFVAFAAAITAYNTATLASRVRAHADGSLEVRNRLRTRRLQRADVDRVMAGRQAGFGSMRRVELLLKDGTTLHLIATEAPPFVSRRRAEEQADELRRWLGDTRS